MKSHPTSKRVPLGPAFITPGEILEEEFLKPMGLSQSALAERMGVPRMRISEIVRGKRAISAETAILLGETFGVSARFWMNLQTSHDLAVVAMKREVAA
ncbi:MAG: HigA family addiction module antitoxin [Verrucomicrobiales bacterium]|jgi:antitoxin HigA-1|nr:HigA family addiction module antitoxin [Verrucomicrobiales bacterium]MDP4638242.1 HigA family addiction module antitoxin [Verrucomicrobiales bacterium]MDP4790800.1 HigA family addiction module antitoxin [Verrucomicrobiales bacterium]MDP4939504.1 HigA family addiction module antitoxin [Verrucomicrobiales bacterium]MDP5006950.1 HigA family addiction module antitoxin [Verrucomicrobiales bacterium]